LGLLPIVPPRQDEVVVGRGGSLDLDGAGTLHVDAIEAEPGRVQGKVTFTFTPSEK
jgi:hypothetical protein